MKRKIVLTLMIIMILSTSVVFADANWGENAGTWIKDQVWWLVLAGVVVVAAKLALKKMWVQFGTFLVLAAITLVVVSGPEKLLTVGNAVWDIIFK